MNITKILLNALNLAGISRLEKDCCLGIYLSLNKIPRETCGGITTACITACMYYICLFILNSSHSNAEHSANINEQRTSNERI